MVKCHVRAVTIVICISKVISLYTILLFLLLIVNQNPDAIVLAKQLTDKR
jgi:hypothetical protein